VKCCEGEEGDDGDRKQVYTYFGKRFAKVYLVCGFLCRGGVRILHGQANNTATVGRQLLAGWVARPTVPYKLLLQLRQAGETTELME